MKQVFLLIVAVVFSTAMYAQDTATLTDVADKEAVTEAAPEAATEAVSEAAPEVAPVQNPELEKQIADAIMSDETLQKETINYLKENPETASSLAEIIEANGDSVDGIIKAVFGDSELAATAVNYVKENPEMLSKAMKLAGM